MAVRRGKLSRADRARVLEMSEAGRSLADVVAALAVEGIEISKQGVHAALKRARDEREAGRGAGTEQEGVEGAEGGGDDGGEVRVAMPDLPGDATAVDRLVWERTRVAIETAERLRLRMLADERFAPAWSKADHQARMYIEQLDKRMPPPPVDPAKDPRNIGARQAVHARVLQVIETAEAKHGRLCPRCSAEVRRARG